MVRLYLKIGALVAVIYTALLCGLFVAMLQPPPVFGRIMAKVPTIAFFLFPFRPMWLYARRGRLKVGDPAPDFALTTAEGSKVVHLSSFRGQEPVVLIFGSHT